MLLENASIGILGGGQLGKMLLQKAQQLGLQTAFLENDPHCPAAAVSPNFTLGNIRNYDDVMAFGQKHSHITVEIENVNLKALYDLEKKGLKIHPAPHVLEIIKNKGRQKQFYTQHDIPTAAYKVFANKAECLDALSDSSTHWPLVLKACEGGYDGKGVWVLSSLDEAKNLPDMAFLWEEKIAIHKELSVLCYSNGSQVQSFETVEMVFDPTANLVDYILHPAQIDPETDAKAQAIAKNLCKTFGLNGLLAVELFLCVDGSILVNEVAPRPHNSGHHSIESHSMSQYEAHLRALLALPFPENKSRVNYAAMVNVLGAEKHQGKAKVVGLDVLLSLADTQWHWYGKKETKPKRKMGHITLTGSNKKELLDRCAKIKENIHVIT